MKKYSIVLAWIARLVAAIILLQTLYFKFTGAEESKFIFSQLGAEPWGRIASGLFEFITAIFLLIPRTTAVGAVMGLGIMTGAIFSHLFILGIEVQDDGGLLFIYSLLVFNSCLYLAFRFWKSIPFFNKYF